MKEEFFPINQSIEKLSIGKTKLYSLLKKHKIKPKKIGKCSHLSTSQIAELKEILEMCSQKNDANEQRTEKISKKLEEKQEENSTQQEAFLIAEKIYQKQIEDLKTELAEEQEAKNKISYLLGEANGKVQQLEQRLLITQKKPSFLQYLASYWKK